MPYGEWPSPVTAACLVQGSAGISEVIADPVQPWLLWWAESRPDEGGRTSVMRRDLRGGESEEVTPRDANVRTLVHEYGGGSWWPHDGSLFYVEFTDQRLRRIDRPGAEPVPLTAEPPEPRAWRYADGRVTPNGRWSVCVRERHGAGGEPANEIAAVAADGSQRVVPLWSDADFVMTPRVSPDGSMLAWISWDHPNMPWDATRLHVHEFGDGELGAEVAVLGGRGDRSLCEPGWEAAAGGTGSRLLVCSDHDDWWGLYEVDLGSGALKPVVVGDFDMATPPWVFGMQRWAAADGVVAAVAGLPSGDRIVVNSAGVEVADSSLDRRPRRPRRRWSRSGRLVACRRPRRYRRYRSRVGRLVGVVADHHPRTAPTVPPCWPTPVPATGTSRRSSQCVSTPTASPGVARCGRLGSWASARTCW